MLCQPGFVLAYFPLRCHVPCFDGKVLPLLSSARCFKVRDLHRQPTPALFKSPALFFDLAFFFLGGGYPPPPRLCQGFTPVVSPRRPPLSFAPSRVHRLCFRVAVIRS